MTTRTVHLEKVIDSNAGAFSHALRRFIACRGTPQTVLCDNTPNFKTTDEVSQQILENKGEDSTLMDYYSKKDIEWKYITPLAPWQGGV